MSRLRLSLTLAAAVVALSATGAQASTGAVSKASAAPDRTQQFCTVDLSHANRQDCFSSSRAAISHATGGTAQTLPQARADASKTAGGAAQSTTAHQSSNYLVSALYWWQNYQAPVLYLYGDHPCTTTTADVDYSMSSFWNLNPAHPEWDNNVRSFDSFNNCWTKVYDFTYWWGDSVGYADYVSNLGAMNDRTSSLLIS